MSQNIRKLLPGEFLDLRSSSPVVDVRSPGEYSCGHIPGAFNIPLFNDSERAEVGTIYKKEGSFKAVLRGIDLAAPEMSAKIREAAALASGKPLLIYCWRGGMRSEAMAWLFSLGGLTPIILDGGYKAYRNHVLEDLGRKRNLLILGGLTGSGKTHILRHMISSGAQATDLEGLACHKGSAFGAMGQPPQPSSEHFANLLYDDLNEKNADDPIWLEDESRNIGTVFMPDTFINVMLSAPVIALMMSIETRLPRLLKEYTMFPPDEIIASVMKLSRRLGGERTKTAVGALQKGDFETAIRITLEYYDKSYYYGLSKRPPEQVVYIETDTDDVTLNAARVIEAASGLM